MRDSTNSLSPSGMERFAKVEVSEGSSASALATRLSELCVGCVVAILGPVAVLRGRTFESGRRCKH